MNLNSNGVPTAVYRLSMPQSLSVVLVHLVFSTKDRRPFLQDPQLRARAHSFLGEASARLNCPPERVGGVEDHVHILARLGRTTTQSDWVKELKRSSTVFLRELDTDLIDFSWQRGYGAFSVGVPQSREVRNYIQNQQEHHRKVSFQDEFRGLLREHEMTWEEQYIWD